MSQEGVKRLQREYKAMSKSFKKQVEDHGRVTDMFVAAPDPDNMFVWYYIIFGFEDEPFKGGYYMGKLVFPKEYPWKPPEIWMVTEQGRFSTH